MAVEDLQGKASELMKKVMSVGVGALFLTEESLRGLVSEWKIPKELIQGVLESASKNRKEFLAKLSSDALDRVLDKVDVKTLIEELLRDNEIELSVKVKVKPKGESVVPTAD